MSEKLKLMHPQQCLFNGCFVVNSTSFIFLSIHLYRPFNPLHIVDSSEYITFCQSKFKYLCAHSNLFIF